MRGRRVLVTGAPCFQRGRAPLWVSYVCGRVGAWGVGRGRACVCEREEGAATDRRRAPSVARIRRGCASRRGEESPGHAGSAGRRPPGRPPSTDRHSTGLCLGRRGQAVRARTRAPGKRRGGGGGRWAGHHTPGSERAPPPLLLPSRVGPLLWELVTRHPPSPLLLPRHARTHLQGGEYRKAYVRSKRDVPCVCVLGGRVRGLKQEGLSCGVVCAPSRPLSFFFAFSKQPPSVARPAPAVGRPRCVRQAMPRPCRHGRRERGVRVEAGQARVHTQLLLSLAGEKNARRRRMRERRGGPTVALPFPSANAGAATCAGGQSPSAHGMLGD